MLLPNNAKYADVVKFDMAMFPVFNIKHKVKSDDSTFNEVTVELPTQDDMGTYAQGTIELFTQEEIQLLKDKSNEWKMKNNNVIDKRSGKEKNSPIEVQMLKIYNAKEDINYAVKTLKGILYPETIVRKTEEQLRKEIEAELKAKIAEEKRQNEAIERVRSINTIVDTIEDLPLPVLRKMAAKFHLDMAEEKDQRVIAVAIAKKQLGIEED